MVKVFEVINMRWQKQITDWLHSYIDDITDLDIDKETVTLRVNNKIIGIIVFQRIGE
tara:strand:+ start:2895 stop:3065 length:171 start_codon:yes stop_codon:yes gene_type:complete